VLETLWVRLMVLVFGSTTFAVSTVLTAFMGGLALGSWAAGRRAERWADPRRALAAYAVLELAIGLYALGLPWLTGQLHLVHAALWGTSHSSYHSFALLRFLLAGALLLLPTMAMGATLPILARFVAAADPRRRPLGLQVGLLYAINTAGAVLGVFLAGFVLLPTLGVRATNLCACLADIALACVAFVLWRSSRNMPQRAAPPPEVEAASPPDALARLALVSIAISGALAMVLQVAWTRALSLVIGSSTYAFSLILVCFLIGLAGGAALYARRQARQPDQAGNLAVVHLLTALTAFAGVQLMDQLPAVLLLLMQRIELAPRTVFLVKFLIAGAVIVLPAFFMGMVFPAVIQLCSVKGGAGAVTGRVYAVNTLGAIVGSFAGGFLLVPLLGLQPTMVFMVLIGLLLATLFGLHAQRGRTRLGVSAAVLASALAVLGLARPWDLEVMTAGVFRISRYQGVLDLQREGRARTEEEAKEGRLRLWQRWARGRVPLDGVVDTMSEPSAGYGLVYHREGVTTTASLSRTVDLTISQRACWVRHALLVNGKPDASLSVLHNRPTSGCQGLLGRPLPGPGLAISPSGDAETQILSGLLPIVLHDDPGRPPQDLLVIGWGSGITAGAALQGPVRQIVAVELEQAVVEAARHFEPHNHTPQRDRRLSLVNEDGRNYLEASSQRYDVVISEPSNPWIAGCGNLFTREFFELVHKRLNRSGVYLQWLQAYEIAPLNVWSILGTLSDVFPSVHVFRPVQAGSDLLLVARKDQRPLSWPRLQARLRHPGIKAELQRIRIGSPADVVVRLLAGPGGVRRVSRGAPRNTDDNARIEFAAPRDLINYRRYSAGEITRQLGESLPDPLVAFSGATDGAAAEVCWAGLRSGQVGRARRTHSACAAADAILRASDDRLERRAVDAVTKGLSSKKKSALLQLVGRSPRAALALADQTLPRPFPDLAVDPRLDLAGSSDPASDPGVDPALDPISDPRGLSEHHAVSAILGHLHALAGDTYLAMLFLSAAQQTRPTSSPAYQPLDALLARQYLRSGDGVRATQIARRLVFASRRKAR
jgi:spermidine synthase